MRWSRGCDSCIFNLVRESRIGDSFINVLEFVVVIGLVVVMVRKVWVWSSEQSIELAEVRKVSVLFKYLLENGLLWQNFVLFKFLPENGVSVAKFCLYSNSCQRMVFLWQNFVFIQNLARE